MARRKFVGASLVVLAVLMLVPAAALAQTGIAGVVKDATGAVLPGVTVEAASPALIEKVRTVVTDSQGQYKIVDLRPGVYTVTFSLVGFSTVKREGIELTTNFTAQVNPEMRVGALEETVTVSGESPVVDVQNVIQQKVVTIETVNAIPNSRMFEQLTALIPGITASGSGKPTAQDVGGTASGGQQKSAIHGGRQGEQNAMIDGLPVNVMNSLASSGAYLDAGAIQEFSYELGAVSAETATGGVTVNMIPRDGGNRFTFTLYGAYTNSHFQSDNLSNALKASGLTSVNSVNRIWDVNPGVGGPIKKDKVWFFGSVRSWGEYENAAGIYYAKDPLAIIYTPDLSRPALDDSHITSESLRLTWQATPKNKFNILLLKVDRCICHTGVSSLKTPEASARLTNPRNQFANVTWSAPVTNRLLLEAGLMPYVFKYQNARQPETPESLLSVTERSTGLTYRSASSYTTLLDHLYNYKGSASYVTGSHAFKVGFSLQQANRANPTIANGDMNLALLNGVPSQITVWATPYTQIERVNANLGLYAQDRWTVNRLTFNAGIRLDHINESVPAQNLAATRFASARNFAEITNVPNWYDVSPRVGGAYDLFGNSKTAIKASLSRYVTAETGGFAATVDPLIASTSGAAAAASSANSATRTWNDSFYPVSDPRRGNFAPDCDFSNPLQNGECGPLTNASFGKQAITTQYDPRLQTGWQTRGYNWETSVGIQHELLPRLSVNFTYTRRSYGNFTVNDNSLVAPSDYTPFCVTAPMDARLPGGGGNQICGLGDLNPNKVGQVNNVVKPASDYGTVIEHWNGFDLTFNLRTPRGDQVSGGMSTGRTLFDNCDVAAKVDNPDQPIGQFSSAATLASPATLRCHQERPFFLPQVKFNGIVKLPWWGLQASGTFQAIPGPEITARWAAPNSVIAPSLGRNLAAGATATTAVELVQPGTLFAGRLYQTDARLTKSIRMGRTRINANLDLYNMFNASPILAINSTYGPAWQRPTYILAGRLFKFGATVDF